MRTSENGAVERAVFACKEENAEQLLKNFFCNRVKNGCSSKKNVLYYISKTRVQVFFRKNEN